MQLLDCPKCKFRMGLGSAPTPAVRCPNCAQAIRVRQRTRPTASWRVGLGLLGVVAICAAGGLAWQFYGPSGSEPEAEEVAVADTSPADTPVPSKPEGQSAPATSPATAPAVVRVPKETASTPTKVATTTTRAERPPPTQVGPPPPATTPKDPPKVTPPAFTYWLARKPDPARQEYIFDTRVPADLAAMIACTEPPYVRFQAGVQKLDWTWKGTKYVLLQNRLSWKADDIERGRLGLVFQGGRNDSPVSIADPDWNACKEQLLAQAVTNGDTKTAAVIVVKIEGMAKPDLRVNLSDGPTGRSTTKPYIVTVAQKNQVYVCWQAAGGPTPRIRVYKIAADQLEQGSLTAVREVDSLGTLVGFTVDEAGTDYVLTAKTEDFANTPSGSFVNDIHKVYRKDVLVVYRNGKATDLNSDKFAGGHPFYGVTNFGTGRLAVSTTHLAATFSRRLYTAGDNLIHQHASDLIVARDLSQVAIKAGNVVSHSFSQRLIVDGADFIALHAGDSYPYAGLIFEKYAKRAGTARFNAFACPTNGNSLFFELGGVTAESDGYPVLFTATRNTMGINNGTIGQVSRMPAELALVYVVKNCETKRGAKSPYDTVSAGTLAGGYAEDEEFTADNAAWNPASARFDKQEARTFKRRVLWLTEHNQPGGASNAKLVKLRDGQHIALWTEGGRGTHAMLLTIKGPPSAKSITKGDAVELKGVPLPLGDDAMPLRIGGAPHAAWITSNGQILLHTLDAELAYKVYPLNVP